MRCRYSRGRLAFSFTGDLRSESDSSTEFHQRIRKNHFYFRKLGLSLSRAEVMSVVKHAPPTISA
jgi:hypothetical protein